MAMPNVHHYTSLSDPLNPEITTSAPFNNRKILAGLCGIGVLAMVALVGVASPSSGVAVVSDGDLDKAISFPQMASDPSFLSFADFWANVQGELSVMVEDMSREYEQVGVKVDLSELADQAYDRIIGHVEELRLALDGVHADAGKNLQHPDYSPFRNNVPKDDGGKNLQHPDYNPFRNDVLKMVSDAVQMASQEMKTTPDAPPSPLSPHDIEHVASVLVYRLQAAVGDVDQTKAFDSVMLPPDTQALLDNVIANVAGDFWTRVEAHVDRLATELAETFVGGLFSGDMTAFNNFVSEVDEAISTSFESLAAETRPEDLNELEGDEVDKFVKSRILEAVERAAGDETKSTKAMVDVRLVKYVKDCDVMVVDNLKARYHATMEALENEKSLSVNEIEEHASHVVEAASDMWAAVGKDVEAITNAIASQLDQNDPSALADLASLVEQRIGQVLEDRTKVVTKQASAHGDVSSEMVFSTIEEAVEIARKEAESVLASLPSREEIEEAVVDVAHFLEENKEEIDDVVRTVMRNLEYQYHRMWDLISYLSQPKSPKSITKSTLKSITTAVPKDEGSDEEDLMDFGDDGMAQIWEILVLDMRGLVNLVLGSELSDGEVSSKDLTGKVVIALLQGLEEEEQVQDKKTVNVNIVLPDETHETVRSLSNSVRRAMALLGEYSETQETEKSLSGKQVKSLTSQEQEQAEAVAQDLVETIKEQVETVVESTGACPREALVNILSIISRSFDVLD